jgi:hypothetical protein
MIIYDWSLPWKSGVECEQNRFTDWLGRKHKVYKNRTEIRIFNRINYSNIITHIKDNLFEEKKKKLFLKHYIAFFFSSIKWKEIYWHVIDLKTLKMIEVWIREGNYYSSIEKYVIFENYKLNKHS